METGLITSDIMNNWIFSKKSDILFLLLPVWLCWGIFFFIPESYLHTEIKLWVWVVFVVGIDVSHVWSTIFRSYADKEEFAKFKPFLVIAPFVILGITFTIVSISQFWFWRLLAYYAVYHFIKQQYGFLALYKLKESNSTKKLFSDKFIIYFATLYPILFWHITSDIQFHWFVEGDFIKLNHVSNNQWFLTIVELSKYTYWIIICLWVVQEIRIGKSINLISTGKILWVLTTAINWYFAIVYFNSDLVFMVTNIAAHGIPYIYLIYRYRLHKNKIYKTFNKLKWGALLICTIGIFAFTEEYFWDMLIYNDHAYFFSSVVPYSYEILNNKYAIAFAISILSLPQILHYFMDGIIWKMNKNNSDLTSMFKQNKN